MTRSTNPARRLGAATAALALLLSAWASPASAQEWTAEQGEAFTLCTTPFDSVMSVLYWMQPEQRQAHADATARASACFDGGPTFAPTAQGPDLARMILRLLDAKNLFVEPEDLPKDTGFTDAGGVARFRLFADTVDLRIVKREGRWVWPRTTLEKAERLYHETVVIDLQSVLPSWALFRVLGLELWQWIGIVALFLIGLLIRRVFVWIVHRWVRRLTKRIRAVPWLDALLDGSRGALGFVVFAVFLALTLPILQLPVGFSGPFSVAVVLIGAIGVIGVLFRAIDIGTGEWGTQAAQTDTKLDDQLVPLVRKSLKVLVGIVGVLVMLQNLKVDVGSLVAGIGIGGLAFALAAKDTLANVFGSIMVFIDRPFQIGDFIAMAGSTGTVEEVGFRTSRLRTSDGTLIIIPNARMADTPIENFSERPSRRYRTVLGLTYDTPPAKVQAFVEGVLRIIDAHPLTVEGSAMTRFIGFGASALEVLMVCKFDTRSYDQEQDARHRLNMELLRLAAHLGIEFAFPSQSVYLTKVEPADPDADGPEGPDPMTIATAFGRDGAQSRIGDWDVIGVGSPPPAEPPPERGTHGAR